MDVPKIVIIGQNYVLWGQGVNEYFQVTYFANNRPNTVLVCDNQFNIDHIKSLKPDMIWFVYVGSMSNPGILDQCATLGVPMGLMCPDLFRVRDIANAPTTGRLDVIMGMAYNKGMYDEFERLFPHVLFRSFSSRFVDIEQFYPTDVDKEYDILYYGSNDVVVTSPLSDVDEKWFASQGIDPIPETYNFYPLRKRLFDLLQKNQARYKIKLLTPTGSCGAPFKNRDLADLINKSYLTIATTSRVDHIFTKHIEISAANSVVLGNYPTDFEEMFKGNIVEVSMEMSDEEILAVIDEALADKPRLLEISKRMSEVVLRDHNYAVSLDELNKVTLETIAARVVR